MKRLQIVAVLALVSLASSTAFAGIVHEEVGNQGDLPLDPPYPVLALGLGANSVIGRTSFSGDAVDNFAFSIPSGSSLASITYFFTSSAFIRGSATLTNAMSGFSLVMGDGTAPQPGSLLAVQNLDMIPGLCSALVMPCGPSSPNAVAVTLFANALPVGAGIYSFEHCSATIGTSDARKSPPVRGRRPNGRANGAV